MSTKPSPTPWKVVGNEHKPLPVGESHTWSIDGPPCDWMFLQNKADATLIVRAVNNHERLVHSVRKGLELAEQVHGTGHGITWDCSEEIELFRALLSELEQEAQ